MSAPQELLAALAVAFAAAMAYSTVLGQGRGVRRGVLIGVIGVIALSPLLVDARHRFARFLAGVLAVALTIKVWDVHWGIGQGHRPEFRTFVAFLPNLALIVLRKRDEAPRPGRMETLGRLARAALGFAAGSALLVGCFQVKWRKYPFALEHAAKVLVFTLALVPAAWAAVSALRLLGVRALDPFGNVFAAATPAEFWLRWNRPAQQFFYEDVFKPCGGRRAPVRAILATFAVSAVLHEYLFSITTERVRGLQTAFFLI